MWAYGHRVGLTPRRSTAAQSALINGWTRRRHVWYRTYSGPLKKGGEAGSSESGSWRGLATRSSEGEVHVTFSEDTTAVVAVIDAQTQNRLASDIERYPAYVPPSTHRRYRTARWRRTHGACRGEQKTS